MKIFPFKLIFPYFFLVTFCASTNAQNYFKNLEFPESTYYQRLSQFPNGDILIGDKYLTNDIPDEGFYLMRLNECGEVIWANTYHAGGKRLSFTQVAINNEDEVFVYGASISSSISGDGYILKLSGQGSIITFKHFDNDKEEHPYSLSLKNGLVMVSGLSYDHVNANDSYYILSMDEDLNNLWSKKYQPFEANGEATLTNDNGALFITKHTIVKVDANGSVTWAKEVINNSGYHNYSIPLEVSDGYLIGMQYNGFNWVFKLNKDGELVWESPKIPSYYHVFTMELLANNNVLAIYHQVTTDGNIPSYLLLSPDGEILEQRQLITDFSLNSGFTYLTVHDEFRVNLFGNTNMNAFAGEHGNADFLLQFDLNQPSEDCFFWEKYDATAPNDFDLQLIDVAMTTLDAPYDLITTNATSAPLDFYFSEICEPEIQTITFSTDTLLPCEKEWKINLPEGFQWQDGSFDNPRTLFSPDTYTATKTDCNSEITHTYTLVKENCACNIFIPNAFSPNGDGFNDRLEIFSNCPIEELDLTIYNRWGAVVFKSTTENTWDGMLRNQVVASGVYVILAKGTTLDTFGNPSDFRMVGDVIVLR
ncbi:MAG: gliding motility-associated C-terminal domain-containing protein [Bacteroidota bacterium]